jgi:hypothetical protein
LQVLDYSPANSVCIALLGFYNVLLSLHYGTPIEGKKERKREAEMKAQEMLSGICFETGAADQPFIPYLENFWKPNSPYIKECANLNKKPLSAYYIHQNEVNVRLHVKPFPGFQKITLRKLTNGLIRDWMSWAVDNEKTGRTINAVISTHELRSCTI